MIVDYSNHFASIISYLKQGEHQNFFKDDARLAEGIKKNEPDTVSKLTNCFFEDALGHISQFNSLIGQYLQSDAMRYLCCSYSNFMSVVNKESQDFFKDDHGTLNKKKGLGLHEKIVITIQLIMWSRISLNCHKCICMTVLQFRCKNIGIGERELWSWLHGFTTCVLASTSCVYDMYATALEKKHPSCQVLLVPTSIHHFLGHAMKRFSSTSVLRTCLEIDCLNIATSYLTHHIQGRKGGKEYVVSLAARNDQTLNFYFEKNSRVWVDLIKTFSSFVEEGRVHRHRHGERMFEEDDELSHKDTNPDMTNYAASALVLIGRAPPVASVPSVTEEKYQQLCSQLVKLKKQFHICGMVKALEHESTSMEDKRKSYEECCTKFFEMTFPVKEIRSSYDQYLIKLVAYSGLLIHDILRVKHKKDLLEYQNVFAHVLSFCLDGSYNKKKEMDWKSFFGKLVPRSAFAQTFAQTSDKSPRKLSLYFKKCFESMKIKAPDENELDYYYQQNYFPVRTKIVVESNVNAVFDAIGDGGNGRQTPGVKKTNKQTKGSLGSSEQPTNKNPSSKHKAKVAPIGEQSPGVKKTNKQTKGSLGGSEQPTNKNPSSKHKAKVAPIGDGGNGRQSPGVKKTKAKGSSPKSNKATEADIVRGSNKLQKKHGASQYLSPEGKESGTKRRRTSQRTSPKTKFFSPI